MSNIILSPLGKIFSRQHIKIFFLFFPENRFCHFMLGWSDVVKVSCNLRLRGIQLILASSWARPAILVAGKGRGVMFYFFCFFTFIPVPLSSLSLSFISLFHLLYYLFSPFLWETAQNDPQRLRVDVPLNPNTIN